MTLFSDHLWIFCFVFFFLFQFQMQSSSTPVTFQSVEQCSEKECMCVNVSVREGSCS